MLTPSRSRIAWLRLIFLLIGLYQWHGGWIFATSSQPHGLSPDALTLTCPPNITIQCSESTLPATTGSPVVVDPGCIPTVAFYDYQITPPANGSEMRWVLLPGGMNSGSCSSATNCSNGILCFGLQYTPAVSGTLTSYTTGFFLNCYNGSDPVITNSSCVMNNNGGMIEDCANSGIMLMNSSGNGGALLIQKYVPVIIHQVCMQLGAGADIFISEDESTDLTASIELPGGTFITEIPAFTNFTADFDYYCSPGCQYPNTIYRRFVVTDNCGAISTCNQQITIKDSTPPVLTCPPNITILLGASTLPANTGTATAVDNCDPSLVVTYQDSLPSGSCPPFNFVKRKWHTVDTCGNQSNCVQWITINDQGTICGSVKNDLGQGVGGVQIKLYADLNNNLVQDAGDTVVTTTTTAAGTGAYCFTNVRPCQFIVTETQPAFYNNISDYDHTPDPDGDDSADGPDNQIPVNITTLENDLDNDFIDLVCPSVIPTLPLDTICSGQSEIYQISDLNLGSLTYSWNFGSGSAPGTGTGLGPHTVSYVTTTQNQSSGASVVLTIAKVGCTNLVGQVTLIDVNPKPNAAINTGTGSICYYTNKTFQPVAPIIPGATYNWNFGNDAVPLTATGYGPHTVYYTLGGTKTAKLVIHPNEAGAQCPDSSTVSFLINTCPAQILGYILSNTNVPLNGVTVKLFADADLNGMPDNGVALKTVTSFPNGTYVMASLTPGNCVIEETQPNGWSSFNDYDLSNDGDLVANVSGVDNFIPVTLLPNEVDSMNNFIETSATGSISGNVFVDADGDLAPDTGEGIGGVTLKLLPDSDANGIPDSGTPVATQISGANGAYLFSSVSTTSFLLVETNKAGYISVKDYDATDDGDIILNTNMNNDTIPVTVTNGESDISNFFLDELVCPMMVANTSDTGYASLRFIINCADPGDTIIFNPSLAGQTITLTSQHIDLNKNLVFISSLTPRVTISSTTLGLFTVLNNVTVEFKDIDLKGGNVTASEGSIFDNMGTIKLQNVTLYKNPSFPSVERLIRNQVNSSLFLFGTCMLKK